MIQIIQVNIITGKRAQAALLQKAHSSEAGSLKSSSSCFEVNQSDERKSCQVHSA